MPHAASNTARRSSNQGTGPSKIRQTKAIARPNLTSESRYTVGLSPELAERVENYAETADTSMSKAIATLVRLGLESQQDRKREFFKRLKQNLAEDDPKQQDRLVNEFRMLILGR
jgi:hypothetical protein